jgi:predicted HTH domain antitoxin
MTHMGETPTRGFDLSAEDFEPAERYLLLLLYAPGPDGQQGEPVKGNLWLQKELYLVSRNVEPLKEDFEAYRLGPFSEAVEEYESQLRVSHFIDVTPSGIELTSKGSGVAEDVWRQADEKERALVSEVKSLLNDLSRDELLVLVYSTFEEATVNSDIKDEIEAKRKEAAVSLFRKKKVTLERAAKISKMSLSQFMKLLKTRKIPAIEVSSEEIREELLSDLSGNR